MLLQCIQSVPPVQAATVALKHRFKLRANTMTMDNKLRFIIMIQKFTGEFISPDIIAHDTGHVNRLYHIVDWYGLRIKPAHSLQMQVRSLYYLNGSVPSSVFNVQRLYANNSYQDL